MTNNRGRSLSEGKISENLLEENPGSQNNPMHRPTLLINYYLARKPRLRQQIQAQDSSKRNLPSRYEPSHRPINFLINFIP